MTEMRFEGKCYTLINGRWAKGFEIVCETLSKKLNRAFVSQLSSSSLTNKEYDKIIQTSKKAGNYDLAAKLIENLLHTNKRGYYLGELSSCYRNMNKPSESIKLYEIYGNECFAQNAPFLTSVGFAYFDLGNYSKANELARKAMKYDTRENPEPLKILFSNLKRI